MNIIVILIIIAFGSVVVIALLKLSQYADTVPKKAQEETVEKKFIPNIPTAVTNNEDKSVAKMKEKISMAESKKIFREAVDHAFEDNIQNVIRQSAGAEEIAGVLVYSTIAYAYESLKEEKELLILMSGLTDKEFDMYLEQVCKQKIAKYIKSNE